MDGLGSNITNFIGDPMAWYTWERARAPIPLGFKMVYLAGPIDYSPGDSRDWREFAADSFQKYDIATFSPVHAFRAGPGADSSSSRIMAINFGAIFNADLVFANLGDSLSVGTSREIHQAVLWNKPVIAVIDKNPSHYLSDTYHYYTLEQGIEGALSQGGYVGI